MLRIVGECQARIFGLSPAERLVRQACGDGANLLVVRASAVLGDSTVRWLAENPGQMLASPSGKPLAIAVPPDEETSAEQAIETAAGYDRVTAGDGPALFNKKLRKREQLFGMSLEEHGAQEIERALFDGVYKGVTDLVTKWVWPFPALLVTRALASLRVPPNAVTLIGMLLVFVTSYLFYEAGFWLGLAAAWLMTFLDTVDGKLARVTATSSKLGDILDHGTDLVHPPLWWVCLALGLLKQSSAVQHLIVPACGVILLTYLVGRLVEGGFKASLGFNQYIWRPFDSHFRLVVARRNTILLIMTIGMALGMPALAFLTCAVWSFVSVLIQLVRFGQGYSARPIQPWLAP